MDRWVPKRPWKSEPLHGVNYLRWALQAERYCAYERRCDFTPQSNGRAGRGGTIAWLLFRRYLVRESSSVQSRARQIWPRTVDQRVNLKIQIEAKRVGGDWSEQLCRESCPRTSKTQQARNALIAWQPGVLHYWRDQETDWYGKEVNLFKHTSSFTLISLKLSALSESDILPNSDYLLPQLLWLLSCSWSCLIRRRAVNQAGDQAFRWSKWPKLATQLLSVAVCCLEEDPSLDWDMY